MLVASLPNVRYLSGFSGSSGALLVGGATAVLFTDSRYSLQVEEEVAGAAVELVSGPPARAAVKASPAGTRIGFEADQLTVEAHRALVGESGDRELIPTRGLVEALRAIKDPAEVLAIERSLRVNSDSFEAGLAAMQPGVTELEVAAVIEYEMRKRGAAAPAFESIVASGPHGARPHARASSRQLAIGDAVVVDIGAMVDGYASDMTRTVFVEDAGSTGRKVYGAVLEAVRQAEAAIQAGARAGDVDARARGLLEEAGFGEHSYGHGTGHGVGLEVHEDPRVSQGRDEPLEEGMVLTVEPGVYVPGWGGVRIEDVVLVEDGGCRLLTPTPKGILTV
jgi:Xaa-Pro aminopeptidase